MKLLRAILLSSIAVLILACSAQSAKQEGGPSLKLSGKSRIAIPEDGFGKEYLLSTSVIPQSGAATSRGMNGRVVTFELYEDGVDMYESTKGQVVTEDLPARRLLATFPVIESEGDGVVIDFNAGMRRLAYGGWYVIDSGFDPAWFERAAEIPLARVFQTNLKDGVLEIRQSVQARSRNSDPDLETRLEIRYFISPYVAGEFESRETHPEENRFARYFSGASLLETESGRVSQKISRFDTSNPITFYYSSNTPEDMKEAVSEGILYWNKAFGQDLIRAEEAPEGVTAPNPDMNIIQWVPWDTAGFAYADALIDPLTGETKHGQAYLTSVFDFSGQSRARILLRNLRSMIDEAEESEKDESDDDGEEERYRGFHSGHGTFCEVDSIAMAKELSSGLEELLADPELTEEAVLKIAQDYVREVTAHEVGHVLGLRHNFAGSLAANLSPVELDEFLKDYIGGEDLSEYKEKSVSTSVMEYTTFEASIFAGWYLKNGDKALAHDAAAIRWGYFDDKKVVEDKMLFGSEEETSMYSDVLRFDYGADPITANYRRLSDAIRSIPNSIIERFIANRAPADPRDRKSLEAVALSAESYAQQIASPIGEMLKWFNKGTRSLVVENQYEFIGDLNQEERWKAHWDRLEKKLEEMGGVDQMLFAHLPLSVGAKTKKELKGVDLAPKVDAEALQKRVKELLDTEAYSTFVGLDGESYEWTDEEKEIIVKRSKKLFDQLEEGILLKTLELYENAPRDIGLAATGKLSDEDPVARLEELIVEFAKTVITKRDKDERISGKVDKAYVEVPIFEYRFETRMAAAKALVDKTGSFEFWAKEAKQGIHADLKKAVEESLNISHFKNFEDKILSRSLREWYLQQQELLKLLPPEPKNG